MEGEATSPLTAERTHFCRGGFGGRLMLARLSGRGSKQDGSGALLGGRARIFCRGGSDARARIFCRGGWPVLVVGEASRVGRQRRSLRRPRTHFFRGGWHVLVVGEASKKGRTADAISFHYHYPYFSYFPTPEFQK